MTQVIESESPGRPTGVLTGPNLAGEVLAGDATAAVVATENESLRASIPSLFNRDIQGLHKRRCSWLRIRRSIQERSRISSGMTTGLGTETIQEPLSLHEG